MSNAGIPDSQEFSPHDGVINFDEVNEPSPLKKWLRYFLFIRPIVRQFRGYVLDIGCGTGTFLEHYDGPSLGIDAHPNNIRLCKKKKIAAIQGDANQFVRKDTFDTVLISHVLEHLNNPSGVITNAYISTKPGGRIIIVVPCYAGFVFGLTDDEHSHIHFIDLTFLDIEMKKLGGTKVFSSIFPPFIGGKYQELRVIYVKPFNSD